MKATTDQTTATIGLMKSPMPSGAWDKNQPLRLDGHRVVGNNPAALFQEAFSRANDLKTCYSEAVRVLRHIKELGFLRVGYITGIRMSDGPLFTQANSQALIENTERIRRVVGYPVFSCHDIFTDKVQARMPKYNQAVYTNFFSDLLREDVHGEHLITTLILTPRWEYSQEARTEFQASNGCQALIYFDGNELTELNFETSKCPAKSRLDLPAIVRHAADT